MKKTAWEKSRLNKVNKPPYQPISKGKATSRLAEGTEKRNKTIKERDKGLTKDLNELITTSAITKPSSEVRPREGS